MMLFIVVCALLFDGQVQAKEEDPIALQIRTWAVKFAKNLKVANEVASNYSLIKASFERDFKITNKGNSLFETISKSLEKLVRKKQDAVEVLYREVESLVKTSQFDPASMELYNSKRLTDALEGSYPLPDGCEKADSGPGCQESRLKLEHSSYFGQPVNFDKSAVHVATNIYTKAEKVLRAIDMSTGLDARFRQNRGSDPYLSFQFFCSSTGFLRLYPAVQWPDIDPDMYECRSRSWYVQAAASAKDVIILLDVSGSMTGLRKEIARNVVVNILETLTDNDFVQVLTFKNNCMPLVPCFDMPVQANQRNIREFKEYLNKLDTQNIANFSSALTEAFELLQKFNRTKGGSQCNQAIMLVTDGAPNNYQEIFQRFNYPNIPVRVFTYLIGREVTDTKEVNWMACHNRGYYTHVTTLAEVREQVLKYIPVMSRPIFISRKHPVIWTPSYPTVTELLLTDNLWEERERARFKAKGLEFLRRRIRENEKHHIDDSEADDPDGSTYEDDYEDEGDENEEAGGGTAAETGDNGKPREKKRRRRRSSGPSKPSAGPVLRTEDVSYISVNDDLSRKRENRDFPESKKRKPIMLTTVAIPVFNVTYLENSTVDGGSHLLGVVGLDVPVLELERLASPFRLGVNAYPLILNKNGHLISHPDLRPMFQDLVKPFHSNVDLLEVELLDNQLNVRDFSQTFRDMRKNMIDGRRGWSELHNVRVHMDGMKRVAVREHRYFYGPVGDSVFSLAIALPQPYGVFAVDAQFDFSNPANHKIDVMKAYFDNTDWNVHPNWTYCEDSGNKTKYINGVDQGQRTTIEQLLRNFKGPDKKIQPLNNRPNQMHEIRDKPCDLELLQSLIYDAARTAPHLLEPGKNLPTGNTKSRGKGKVLTDMNGILSAFVATRSGLMRVQYFDKKRRPDSELFQYKYYRSIDELFYKRAVDFYYHSNSSKEAFVYSVPFNAGESGGGDIVITASRAIMLGASDNQSAPVAVVGVEISHDNFTTKFFDTINQCDTNDCKFRCNSDPASYDCFLLDNNGFILTSSTNESKSQTGRFYGELDAGIFDQLIKYNIYKRVTIYDYQAVCFSKKAGPGSAAMLRNPFGAILKVLLYLLNGFITTLGKISVMDFEYPWRVLAQTDRATDDENPHLNMSATQVRPCDREIDLYIMANLGENPTFGNVHQCNVACNHTFIVQPVYDSNMILLAVEHKCMHCARQTVTLEAKEALGAIPTDTNATQSCIKTPLDRQRPDTCYNYHAAEKEMLEKLALKEQCGSSTTNSTFWPLLLLGPVVALLLQHTNEVFS